MQPEQSVQEQIRQLEQRLIDPAVRRSRQLLESLLADEFVEFGSSGSIYTKREVIEALAGEELQHREIANFQVAFLAEGVVLATYVIKRGSASNGTPAYSLRSSIWKLNLGRWQLFFHQGTPVGSAQ